MQMASRTHSHSLPTILGPPSSNPAGGSRSRSDPSTSRSVFLASLGRGRRYTRPPVPPAQLPPAQLHSQQLGAQVGGFSVQRKHISTWTQHTNKASSMLQSCTSPQAKELVGRACNEVSAGGLEMQNNLQPIL